jgi:hypothetical protein
VPDALHVLGEREAAPFLGLLAAFAFVGAVVRRPFPPPLGAEPDDRAQGRAERQTEAG